MAKPLKIAENLYWVGARDWNIRNFHGYNTRRGTSYNAYLITGDTPILIDSVKASFADQLLDSVSRLVDPSTIRYVISNHSELDHSGGLGKVMQAAPKAEVIATAKGVETLKKYFPGAESWNFRTVKTGDSLEACGMKFDFISTPMAHWPDSMVTYCGDMELLFSMDCFGQHYAAPALYDDEVSLDVLMYEAKKYYANILMLFGSVVKKTVGALDGLKISMIAPSHGVIWRKNLDLIIKSYLDWAECKAAKKLIVVYDTMWGSTEAMAQAIIAGAAQKGVATCQLNLTVSDMADVVSEVLDTAALVIGSSTLNNVMLPNVAGFLTYLQGLKPAGKYGTSFGSHGWKGGGAKDVYDALEKIGIERVCEPITCSYRPTHDDLAACEALGEKLAERIISGSAG